jgi:hypothetical protein
VRVRDPGFVLRAFTEEEQHAVDCPVWWTDANSLD